MPTQGRGHGTRHGVAHGVMEANQVDVRD